MLILTGEKRKIVRKKLKKERSEGRMPAVFYGPKEETTSIMLNQREFFQTWKNVGESTVISLKIDGEEKEALIHDVDVNPVTDEPIHADFYIIEKGKEIVVSIPLEFIGEAPAIKTFGGILVKVMHELEIKVLPKDLPQSIEVDLAVLTELDSHVTVGDLKKGEYTFTVDAKEIVVSISGPQEDEEEEETTTIDMDSIEVKKKGKEEGEEGDTSTDASNDGDK